MNNVWCLRLFYCFFLHYFCQGCRANTNYHTSLCLLWIKWLFSPPQQKPWMDGQDTRLREKCLKLTTEINSGGTKRGERKGSCEYGGLFSFGYLMTKSASQHTLCSLWTNPQGCLEACLSRKSETQQALKLWGVMWWRQRDSFHPTWSEEKNHFLLLFFCVLFTSNFSLIMVLLWAAMRWTPLCSLGDLCPILSLPLFPLSPPSLHLVIHLANSSLLSFAPPFLPFTNSVFPRTHSLVSLLSIVSSSYLAPLFATHCCPFLYFSPMRLPCLNFYFLPMFSPPLSLHFQLSTFLSFL